MTLATVQRIALAHGCDAIEARAIAGNVAMAIHQELLDLAGESPRCECCHKTMRASYSQEHLWRCACGLALRMRALSACGAGR